MKTRSELYDSAPLLDLEMAKFRLSFTVKKKTRGREIVPAFRSCLGYILKGRFCPFSDYERRPCRGCSNERGCLYTALFSPTFRSVDRMVKSKTQHDPPRPYTLNVLAARGREIIGAGEDTFLEVSLFGEQAVTCYRPMLESLYHAAVSFSETPVSKENSGHENKTPFIHPQTWNAVLPVADNGKWRLSTLEDYRIPSPYPGRPLSDWIKVLPPLTSLEEFSLHTPVQLSRADGNIRFTVFLQSIISRLRDLKRIYHPNNDMGAFPKPFYALADQVRTFSDLKINSFDWYSFHRQKHIPLGGFKGNLIFKGDLTPFFPLLAAGFFIGVGKKTVYGLGRFGTRAWDMKAV